MKETEQEVLWELVEIFAKFIESCQALGNCCMPGGCSTENAVGCFDLHVEIMMAGAAETVKQMKLLDKRYDA